MTIEDFGFTTHAEKLDIPVSTPQIVNTSPIEDKLVDVVEKIDKLIIMVENTNIGEFQESDRLNRVYEIVAPLFQNLIETSDNEWIKWPNRKPLLEAKLEELKRLTQG